MITTQRLIIIYVMLNIVVGAAMTLHSGIQEATKEQDNGLTSVGKELAKERDKLNIQTGEIFFEEDPTATAKNTGLQVEASIGNKLTWGQIIMDVAFKGINPFSLMIKSPYQTESRIETDIRAILTLFRTLFALIIGIELYMLMKNGKTS